jgi:hypothetical protein
VAAFLFAADMATLEVLAGERQNGESRQALVACNDYLRMGPGRSLASLHARYRTEMDQTAPPTKSLRTLKEWSTRFAWQERAEQYDQTIEADKSARVEKRRRKAMEAGLALDHERIIALKKLAKRLRGYLSDEEKVWLRDYKGTGEFMHEIERFNAPLVEQYRATLDDLAKEKGERKQRTEISGPDGKPIETTSRANYANLTTQELRELASLLAKAEAETDNTSDA